MQILSSKTLCKLLSVLLLIGSQPVGYRHAHAGGDELHHHSGCQLCQHLSFDEDCHAQADDEADHEEQLITGSTSHVHLTFLGMSLCIPGEDIPLEDDSENLSVEPLQIISGPFVAHDASRDTARNDLPSQTLFTLPVCPEREQLSRRSPPVTSPPLCDVARRELSGVLLI